MALISGAFITRLGPPLSLQRCESSLEGSWSVYFALMLVWQSNKHGALWVTRVAFISPWLAIRSKPFTKERDLWHRKRKVVFLFVTLPCSERFGNSSSWRGNGKHRLCTNRRKLCIFSFVCSRLLCERGSWRLTEGPAEASEGSRDESASGRDITQQQQTTALKIRNHLSPEPRWQTARIVW